MKNKFLALFMLILVISIFAACNDETTKTQETNDTSTQEVSGAFPVTITDALDKDITLKKAPERIVSLIPSNTEILFSLGMGSTVVGVNDYDNYPPEVKDIEKIGGTEYNLEMIISLQPDLVLAHESGLYGLGDGIEQLEAAGIPVFVVRNAVDFEETYMTIEQIGQLTGKADEAKKVNEGIQSKLTAIQDKIKDAEPKSAFVVVGMEPDIYAVGTKTYLDEMLKVINVKNAVEQEGWPMYSAEDFAASNADYIIATYESDLEAIQSNEMFANMKAVQANNFKLVDSDTTSRQGPRLADGVESIAKAIYPEIFGE